MKDQSKVTTKARSERKKQSNMQKKEEFRERIAAYLNSQDEAKRSVVPGAYVLQFDIDTIEEEKGGQTLLKKEETKADIHLKAPSARMDKQTAQNEILRMQAAMVRASNDAYLQSIDEGKKEAFALMNKQMAQKESLRMHAAKVPAVTDALLQSIYENKKTIFARIDKQIAENESWRMHADMVMALIIDERKAHSESS